MINRFIKISLLFVFLGCIFMDADAQSRRRSRRGADDAAPVSKDAANNNNTDVQQQNTNNNQAPAYNPYGNIPIEQAAPMAGGLSDTVKKSIRNDAAFERNYANDRTVLPYEHLRWDDALFAEKVWREIDLREKLNMSFRYRSEDDNGDQRFISILLRAVKSGEVTAFSPEDDRFTTPLSSTEIGGVINGGAAADTTPVYDPNDPTKIIKYVVTSNAFNPDNVLKLRIKEEWVFDREASRMFVRILGIAPLKTIYQPDGVTERGTTPMFWVYYPDLRPILAGYEVYNPKNMGSGRMTWEELFESRMFSSYITKSTMDNSNNRYIRQMIKDPILGLLEGENIKDKILNYEQDLWSY